MRLYTSVFIFLFMALSIPLRAGDDFCGIKNTAFQANEVVTFRVYYTLGVFIAAGEATFHSSLEQLNGKAVYHIVGDGKTYGFYDNFFKVRDRYETYLDTATLLPVKFIRNIFEGGFKKYENVTFNKVTEAAITTDGVFKVPPCVQDVLSAVYYARNIDFNKLKPEDKIPFTLFLDNQVYNVYIRYMGKEVIKTKYGKFHTIKFRPLLIKGTIFEGGEKMTVWVSDDQNRLPLKIESPITVGSIQVHMMSYRDLRYPLSSLMDVH